MTSGGLARAQETLFAEGYDYVVGSPHLRHAALRNRVNGKIRDTVTETLHRRQSCEVLEVGAGHGSFTETVLAAGGRTTVTEMSKASYELLRDKFREVPQVRVMYDNDGNAPLRDGAQYDVILLISVIHHIPDYIAVIASLCDNVLRPGGSVVTFQDPLWYPRQTRWAQSVTWGSYFAWRVTHPRNIRRGLRTRWRRLKGTFDDDDLVEYHVVRSGVDDHLLEDLFRDRFAYVEVDRYFSTIMPLIQRVGAKYFPPNTFGLVARGREVH
jgi:SAM-dependent methyltransferase